MSQKPKNESNNESDDELKTSSRKSDNIKAKRKTLPHWKKFTLAGMVCLIFVGIGLLYTPKQISVPPGKTRTIKLPDGTQVTLSSGTSLNFGRWFLYNRTVTLRGEAFFVVKPGKTPFEVKAGQGRIYTNSANFEARYWLREYQYKTSVYVKEGQAAFSSIFHQDSIIVKANEYSWVSANSPIPSQPKHIKAFKAMAWLHHGFSFTNQPLAFVFQEISRRFNVNIRIKPIELANERVTFSMQHVKNAEIPIIEICRRKGFTYTQKGNTFTITKSS